jgi:hypothetical protein
VPPIISAVAASALDAPTPTLAAPARHSARRPSSLAEAWRWAAPLLLVACIILLGSYHIKERTEDPEYAARDQMDFFLANQAGDPTQYRVLSEWMIMGVSAVTHSPPRDFLPYLVVRFGQAVALLTLAFVYFGQLGARFRTRLLGLALLTGIISLTLGPLGQGGVSLDRFMDAIMYLAGGVLVLAGLEVWIPALMVLAILNRETSGLIPMLVVANHGLSMFRCDTSERRRAVIVALAGWAVWAVIYVALKQYFGPQVWFEHVPFGWAMFVHSLKLGGPSQFYAMVVLLPVLAVVALRVAPPFLRRLFWLVVPIWLVIHFGHARFYEGMLYLAPIALILVPLALIGLDRASQALAERGADALAPAAG